MKLGKLLLGSLASLALLVGCDNKEEDLGAPSIKLNPETVTFEKEAGTQTITVTSSRDWSIKDNPEWVSVNPSSGKASSDPVTVEISVLANEGKDRAASIVFAANTVSRTLAVSQKGSVETNYTTLESVRKAGVGTLAENTVVKVVVISSVGMNNLTSKKNVYVQDETAGIQIRFDANNTDWEFGAELEIDLSGQEVSEFNGALQVNNLPLGKVTLLNAETKVEAKNVTVADFMANKYECQYVAVPDVQVVASDLEKTFVVGDNHTGIYFETKDGSSFEVFSSKYSNFKDQKVPQGSGTLKGIASSNKGKIQIIFGQDTDWEGLTGQRFDAEDKPVETKKATVAEFLKASVGDGVYYELTGKITNLTNETFGNFDLVDETGTVYVYGLTKKKSPTNDKSFAELGLKAGDIVTLAGTRAEYNDDPQVGGPAYYISHVAGKPEPEEPVTPPAEGYLIISEYVEGGSYEKYIEIYNPTKVEVDLSNYSLQMLTYNKENKSGDVQSMQLEAPGAVKVYAHSKAVKFTGEIAAKNDNVINFNGNDPVELLYKTLVVDKFGPDEVTGDFAKDKTMRRKSNVKTPSATWKDAEWEEFPKDTVDGLGQHTVE